MIVKSERYFTGHNWAGTKGGGGGYDFNGPNLDLKEERNAKVESKKIANIWGLARYTLEQRMWLLKPEIIKMFRENEWTQKERMAAFVRQFPDAPKMSWTCMRKFYMNNNVTSEQLYKEYYNFTNKVTITYDDDPVYLNGKLADLPLNS